MMTVQDIGVMLQMLEANYGQRFYDGADRDSVVKLWASQFRDDDPKLVLQGVQNCINTMSYKPTIADIRKRIAQAQMKGQMTVTEAFNAVEKAVGNAYDRESAVKAYNDLPPILRKLVGTPSKLISWHHVSDEAFQTVIMSAIRESYRELAQREADYYALPKPLQNAEAWRVTAPQQASLPEPEIEKSIDQVIEEANRKSAETGMQMTPELAQKHSSRVNAFLAPMTTEERKMYDARQKRKEAELFERMRA